MAGGKAESPGPGEELFEFDDLLVKVFWKLHRFKFLQWIIIILLQIKDMLDLSRFIKKPITKEVDEMDNCHFRTLYKRTWYDDNYTDPDFLCSMQLNTNLNYYTLTEAIVATTRVSLHLCACILYFIMYYHLRHDHITPIRVFHIAVVCVVFGYVILQTWRFWRDKWNLETLMKIPFFSDCMVSVCCGSFSYLFVPILRTVTHTMDTDSVHAVCAIMFGVHLLCNNYGIMAYCVSRPLSMNSAIFSMICLASRLQTDNHCLALVAFGVMSFICFPQFSRMLWDWTPGSVIMISIVTFACYTVSIWLTLFFLLLMFFVVVVSPSLYVLYIQHKQNILGPWDEAKPDLNVDEEEIERGFQFRRNNPPPPLVPPEDPYIVELESRGIGLPL